MREAGQDLSVQPAVRMSLPGSRALRPGPLKIRSPGQVPARPVKVAAAAGMVRCSAARKPLSCIPIRSRAKKTINTVHMHNGHHHAFSPLVNDIACVSRRPYTANHPVGMSITHCLNWILFSSF